MRLVLATRNRKKATEIIRVLGDAQVEVLTLDAFPDCPEVEEDGETFEDNARKKALTVAAHTGLPALADDSGLEVMALAGEPGVRSARYAGEGADDAANLQLLMDRLGENSHRAARFVCVLVWADGAGGSRSFFGTVSGEITHHAKGNNGFGYDPVFQPTGFDRTFAEMTADEKDRLSHRGEALRAFAAWYKNMTPGQ
ncbi:MAG: RdgB/HAM1 family non-canonical purine NTP pyrophosphatase [Magnetococcales bacterium]|nr:RdgB/HAM1 family non-canonical purine NTP pyrophosphatase [Magnetococcales bacterium]